MQRSESNEISRRQLFAVARLAAGAALPIPDVFFGDGVEPRSGKAQPRDESVGKQGTDTTFNSPKQIDAGLLSVGYTEDGPADGPAVILLHGWPYDIHNCVDDAPLLAAKGYRVIIPYPHGYGTRRFLPSSTFRNGQQSLVAQDILHLMDALKIQKAILAGFDWGARTANIMAVLWPERCKALVSVGGYLIGSPKPTRSPCRPKQSSRGSTSIISPLNAAEPGTSISPGFCDANLADRFAQVEL
jgi:pimeloyl-ACP methyl ester carboxylesterase